MRILYVAPGTKEQRVTDDQQRLLRDIGSMAISYLPLVGNVTVDDVVTRLREGTYDVAVFMAHSFGTGIQLSPGEVLEPAMLGSVARYGLKLVVLLACESVTVGSMVVTSAQVDTICTVTQLDTDTAYLTGSLLAQGLADGLSTRDAFEKARPGNDVDYVYLAARRVEVDSKLTGADGDHSATIEEHGRTLVEHGKRLDGHGQRIDTLEQRWRIVIEPVNVVIGMAFLVLVMLIVFAFLAGRG